MKNINALIAYMLAFMAASTGRSQTFVDENFNNGIPNSWSATVPTCGNSQGDSIKWIGTTNGWRGQGMSFTLDSTECVLIDSELPSVYCQANEYLYSPVFDASVSTSLTLEFDHYFRHYWPSSSGTVEVFYNSSWIPLIVFIGADYGDWLNPDHQVIDLTPYISANMQVRFHYQANWDWFWAVDNVKVYAPSAFPVTITSVDPLCNGDCNGSATATPNGGQSPYSYQWDDINSQTTQTATGLCDGTYNVTVIDSNNDTVISTVSIVEPTPLNTMDSTMDVLCNGDSSGFVYVIASGGTSPYSYTWSNGGSTAFISNLPAGSYTVTVTDNNGCTKVDSMAINEPSPLILSVSSTDDNGNCDGTATVNVSGGVSPYVYLWDANAGMQTTQTADSLCAGNYCVTVTDANLCTTDTCVDVQLYVGAEQMTHLEIIRIIPNPNNGRFELVMHADLPQHASIQLTDMFGRVVWNGRLPGHSDKMNQYIELNEISAGMYSLQLQSEQQVIAIKKIIVY